MGGFLRGWFSSTAGDAEEALLGGWGCFSVIRLRFITYSASLKLVGGKVPFSLSPLSSPPRFFFVCKPSQTPCPRASSWSRWDRWGPRWRGWEVKKGIVKEMQTMLKSKIEESFFLLCSYYNLLLFEYKSLCPIFIIKLRSCLVGDARGMGKLKFFQLIFTWWVNCGGYFCQFSENFPFISTLPFQIITHFFYLAPNCNCSKFVVQFRGLCVCQRVWENTWYVHLERGEYSAAWGVLEDTKVNFSKTEVFFGPTKHASSICTTTEKLFYRIARHFSNNHRGVTTVGVCPSTDADVF